MFVVICYKCSDRAVAKGLEDFWRLQRITFSQQAAETLCGHDRISMAYTSGTMGEPSRRIAAQDARNRQESEFWGPTFSELRTPNFGPRLSL